MKETTKTISKELYSILCAQNKLLETIYEHQKIVRTSVVNKDWTPLQEIFSKIDTLSQEFSTLEAHRISVSLKLYKNPDDIFALSVLLPMEMRVKIIEVYQSVKRNLLISKIENDSINEYIRVTQNFMQKVFDEVLPQRRNTLYSSKGEVIKNQPTSVILDTVA